MSRESSATNERPAVIRTSYKNSPLLRDKVILRAKPSKESFVHNDSSGALHEIDEYKEAEVFQQRVRILKKELSKELEQSHSAVKIENIRRIKHEDLMHKKMLILKKSFIEDDSIGS